MLRNALVRHLERQGHDVTAFDSGGELEAFLAAGTPPDLLLLDLYLGTDDGLEIVHRHPSPSGAPWPVILMSGQLGPTHVERAAKLGIAHVLEKPLDLAELDDAMRHTWESSNQPPTSLAELSLVDLLQAFHLAKRTVRLAISGHPTGQLTLVSGELIDARCGTTRGTTALDLLLRRDTATIRTFGVPEAVQPSLPNEPFVDLLTGSLRRIEIDRPLRRFTPADMEAVVQAFDGIDTGRLRTYKVTDSTPAPLSSLPSEAPPSSEPPPSTRRSDVDELVLATLAEAHTKLQLARLDERGDLRWLAISASGGELQRTMAERVARGLHHQLWRWPHRQWLSLVRRDATGSDLAVGIFGQAPWMCTAALTGDYGRHRFFASVIQLSAEASRHQVPRRSSRHTLSYPPNADAMDEVAVNACRGLIQRSKEIVACMVFRPARGDVLRLRGHYSRDTGLDAIPDPRWNYAKALSKLFHAAEEVELYVGSQGGSICAGAVANGQDIVLVMSAPNTKLGSLRTSFRRQLGELEAALEGAPKEAPKEGLEGDT
ncbi:MAG: response regulator [Myxococcales bacterium]|nr:response regulator [Myxococcales bacterium]